MTDQLARAGWAAFQGIESEGGIVAALSSGSIAREAAATLERRHAAIESKAEKILGVTLYPNPMKVEVAVEAPKARPVDGPSARLPGPDTKVPPLTPVRLAAPFEEAGQ